MSEERRARARTFHRISDAYLIATILPLAIVIGYGLGWAFDRLVGTASWGRWIGGGLGVVAGFLEAIRTALRVGREEDRAAGGGAE